MEIRLKRGNTWDNTMESFRHQATICILDVCHYTPSHPRGTHHSMQKDLILETNMQVQRCPSIRIKQRKREAFSIYSKTVNALLRAKYISSAM